MATDSKRNRSDNWSSDEKKHVLDLLTPNGKILENKKTDAETNKMKKTTWNQVHEEFISRFGSKRSLRQIKEMWRRMKLNAKKEFKDHKRESHKTGGGPPPPPLSPTTELIKGICPFDFEDFRSSYDDDASDTSPQHAHEDTQQEPESLPLGPGDINVAFTLQQPSSSFAASSKQSSSKTCFPHPSSSSSSGQPSAAPEPVRKRKSGEDSEVSILQMNRVEHERRMELLLTEHEERMEVFALKKEVLRAKLRKLEDDY